MAISVDQIQPFVRIQRINGAAFADPVNLDRAVDNVFIVSVNPAADSITYQVQLAADASSVVAPTGVAGGGALRTFTIGQNTLAANSEFLLRVTKSSATNDQAAMAEVTLTTGA
jgi:hypothetical protein